MFKILFFASVLCYVCADPPKTESPKQFRYVDDEEPHQPREQRSDRYEEQQKPNNQPIVAIHEQNSRQRDYGVDDTPMEQPRPLVTVDKQDHLLGRNVGVGVNLGRLYQMDLKRDNNFGSKAVNLGLNVLNGLVKVNVQRERDPFSGKRGPILVQVGGYTVYQN